MFNFVRAAGFAAAGLGALIAPTFADPSLAFEIEPNPIQISYIDHASASLAAVGPELEPGEAPEAVSQDVDVPAELAQHAAASVAETPPPAKTGPGIASLAALVSTHSATSVAEIGRAHV